MSACRVAGAVVFVLLAGAAVSQMPQLPQAPPPVPMPQPGQIPSMPTPDQGPQQQPQGQQDQATRSRYQSAGFVGGWCAQGDPTKQTSISYNGAFYNLTNENGDTSMGTLQGKNEIQAAGWQFATGTLTLNGRQIQWSNGTFWARCPTGGGGRLDLNGNWYPNGNRSMQCSIQQRRGNLQLQNENGQRATGSFHGKFDVATNWQGTRINGRVTRDGNRINWDNGTYWIRYRLYTQ